MRLRTLFMGLILLSIIAACQQPVDQSASAPLTGGSARNGQAQRPTTTLAYSLWTLLSGIGVSMGCLNELVNDGYSLVHWVSDQPEPVSIPICSSPLPVNPGIDQ